MSRQTGQIGQTAVTMSREDLEKLMKECARAGSQAAVQEAAAIFRKEYAKKEAQQKDRRLHNVRLLLEHYREFQEHAEQAVYSSRQVEDDSFFESLMTMKDDAVVVDSILRTSARTKIILSHIDRAMEVFETWAGQNGERGTRQVDALYGYYLRDPKKTMQELADDHGVSKATIHGDLRDAEERLAVLIFGVDGLKFQ